MKLPDIDAWLAGDRDFKQGVALYAALGTSTTYQRLFSLGATNYSREVLVRELGGLLAAVPAPALAGEASPGPALEAPALAGQGLASPASPGPALAALDDLHQQLRTVRDERSHLHPQLTARGTGQKRRLGLALRIVELTAQEVGLKAKEAHVRQHGRLPGPVATADVTDEAELRRRLLNLRSRRSKLKDKPEKLAIVEAEISLIQLKLKS
jgi:hypothetical protein